MIGQVALALVFFAGEGVDASTAQATQAAVKERLSREAGFADLSAEHRALLTPKLFVDFTAPPPAFLPPELGEAWKRGSAACAQRVGRTGPDLSPMARAEAANAERGCQLVRGEALWDLFLEARAVPRVMGVELRGSSRPGAYDVVVSLHEPGVRRRVTQLSEVGADRAAAAAVKAVEDVLGGAGTVHPVTRHLLPSVGVKELEAVAFGPPRPAVVPPSCQGGLPGRLEVFPPGKVTRAMEAAYKTVPADKKTGKPLRCDLVVWPSDMPPAVPVAWARLSCPPAQVRGTAKVSDAQELLSQLVDRAVAALCSAERPQ